MRCMSIKIDLCNPQSDRFGKQYCIEHHHCSDRGNFMGTQNASKVFRRSRRFDSFVFYLKCCTQAHAGGDLTAFTVERTASNSASKTVDVLMCGNGQWGGLGNNQYSNAQSTPVRAKNVSGLTECGFMHHYILHPSNQLSICVMQTVMLHRP